MTDRHKDTMAGDVEDKQGSNSCSSHEYMDESVDPRVQIELERLNAATDLINELETELDEARSNFRLLLSETSNRVNHLANKLGACVEKARPYYEARMQAKQLQSRTQKAALRYERATSAHAAAKEMVYLAEEGLNEGRCFDPAWQEMLNHATMRVNEAESERLLSKHDHQQTSLSYNDAERIVQQLHQELKRSITKSRPYFEMKAQFNHLLDEQRQKVHKLEENVMKVKISYADALHNLEMISDEIHQRRDMEDKLTSNGTNRPTKKSGSSKISDSFADLFKNSSVGDTYKSLPKRLSSRTQLLPRSNLLDRHETNHPLKLPPNFSIDMSELSAKSRRSAYLYKELSCPELSEKMNDCESKSPKTKDLQFEEESETVSVSSLVNNLDDLAIGKANGVVHPFLQEFNRSPETAELLDPKYHTLDLNILRIRKESDSESLASTDTADTLDENQIECLLLDQVLPTEDQLLLSSSNDVSPHRADN